MHGSADEDVGSDGRWAMQAGVAARSHRLDPSLLDSRPSHGSFHDDRYGGSLKEQAQRYRQQLRLAQVFAPCISGLGTAAPPLHSQQLKRG
jgi:hypothetical protein